MLARPLQTVLLKALVFGSVLAALGATSGSAVADGLPVLGVDVGSKGVAAHSSPIRYVALQGTRETIVARTAVGGGRVLGFTHISGNFTIPAVAYDGSASGLSADGSRLVLIEPRLSFPRALTRLAIFDARTMQLFRLISFRGDYSFDAISPRGQTLYLIQYTSRRDPTQYNVRAYDLRAGRLLPNSVVDPHERDEVMRGSPITRAASPDGRWAYTLYDGAGKTPFIHALDTSRREARCIDLPVLAGRKDLWRLHLSVAPDGGKLGVGIVGKTLALVDTSKDFRVSVPGGTRGTGFDRIARLDGTLAWLLVGLATVAAALAGRPVSRRLRHLRKPLAPT